MDIEDRNIEIIDDVIAKILREKTPQQRLAIAFNLWTSAKKQLINFLQAEHPDWSDSMIQKRGCKEVISWLWCK